MNPVAPTLPPQRITVLGCTWGLVLGSMLARNGHHVVAWDIAPQIIENLDRTRLHPKLKGFRVPESVRLTADLAEAMAGPKNAADASITTQRNEPDCVLVAIPSHGIRDLAGKCRPTAPWVLCSKGIEEETLLPMADVIESVWGPGSRDRLAVLSGPSFAAEVARGKPTTVCVASTNKTLGEYVQNLFMSNLFRVYTQDDMLGVELGGSLKNVMAIAAGVCDGLGLGDNARAALITRGLAEMTRLGTAMGARHETFSGLTGMGDLILTCCGPQSRNHTFGVLLARGKSPQEALDEIGMVVEGARTARSAKALAEKHGIEMPIVNEVYAVIYQNKKPEDAVRHLMEREAKPEWA